MKLTKEIEEFISLTITEHMGKEYADWKTKQQSVTEPDKVEEEYEIGGRISTGSYKDKDGKTIYTTDVVVEEHEFAQNKDNGAGADSSETPKTDKDGFMETPEGEVPFD